MSTSAASFWIDRLGLQPHPEGGYFAETYRSAETVAQAALPNRFSGERALSTAIYFLLEGTQTSALHRIQADELWHFYAGTPLHVAVIDPTGHLTTIRLGPNAAAGETFQAVVPAGCWFGSSRLDAEGYSLVGCTVAPGFDFADFELATRAKLLVLFPQHRALIDRLTPPDPEPSSDESA
jgi:hypothetical protein